MTTGPIGNNPNPINTNNNVESTGNVEQTSSTGQVNTDPSVKVTHGGGPGQNIQADSLDEPGDISPNGLPEAYNSLDKLQGAMATIHTMMILMVSMNIENKQAARAVKGAERELQQQDLKAAAAKIREAANLVFAAAVASGVVKMASGGMSIGAGAHGMKGLKGATTDADIQKVAAQGRIWDGTSQMLGGSGEILSGALNREAEFARSDQTELEASAQRHETQAQAESEFEQSLKESIQGVMQILQGLMQLSDTDKKIANA